MYECSVLGEQSLTLNGKDTLQLPSEACSVGPAPLGAQDTQCPVHWLLDKGRIFCSLLQTTLYPTLGLSGILAPALLSTL